jgi:hypothetical protein
VQKMETKKGGHPLKGHSHHLTYLNYAAFDGLMTRTIGVSGASINKYFGNRGLENHIDYSKDI